MIRNLITNQGLNLILNVGLGSTAKPTYYLGLKGTGSYAISDTLAAKAWTELTTYTAANRVTWTPGTSSVQQISNSGSPASFTFSTNTTVYGGFLADNNVKGGTTGNLFSVAEFGASKAFIAGEILTIVTTYVAADDGV